MQQAFSNEEYADIMYCYGYCDGDAAAARREYQRRFPNRRTPDVSVFSGVYRRIRESGSVQRRQNDTGRPRLYAPEDEEAIIRQFEDNPGVSTTLVANRLGISQWKAWVTVNNAGLHPYHYTPVQALEEGDPVRRLEFCRFMLNADIENPMFLRKILWTDECKFDKDGIANYHNLHFWTSKEHGNPHKKRVKGSQRRFSLNVWMGIIDNKLIGPHFLPDNLNAEEYENFLRESMFPLLKDVPLEIRRNMLYQHDGCPAHFRITVRQWLDHNFPNRWIGRGGPIPWPPRSPDLTPLDFYVWGHMKSLVYDVSPVPSVEELRQRIMNAANEIRNTLTSKVVKSEVRKRMRICIRNRGNHIEHQL